MTPESIICPPPLSLSLLGSVCPVIKAYISVTISWILMKLGESVGTYVRLIALKFHCVRRSGFALIGQRGKKFFCAFLCVSEHFESIQTHFFFENFRDREASKMRACWSDWLYQSFIKNHYQLSYCSLEIVYAVKDCDHCGALLLKRDITVLLNYHDTNPT